MKRKKCLVFLLAALSLFLLVACGETDKHVEYDQEDHANITATGFEKLEILPDYAQAENWLALPKEDAAPADVIYFYPTAYGKAEGDEDICSIDDEGMRQKASGIFQAQATAFSESCNVYAPYYRQVDATYCLSLNDADSSAVMAELAAADPAAALDYYFENYNQDKPYILAGHSQGSEVLLNLLSDYMEDHPDYYKNMIAAYVIGFSVTEDYLEENPHLKFAENATDTGVIISYNTEAPVNEGHPNEVVREGAICINPLNWQRDETYAGVEENHGSLHKTEDGFTLGSGLADAKINEKRGVLVCSTADIETYASEATDLFGPGSFHGQDYGFYYKNLQENVADRIAAYLD